jgi:hypothetical protein
MPTDALEFLSWIIDGLAGWRYLISPSFRKQTHERWRREGRATVLLDILLGSLAVIFTLFILGLLILIALGRIPG